MWDHLKAFLALKPAEKPDLEAQKLIWNDAMKIEIKLREIIADELDVDIARVTPGAEWYRDFGCTMDVIELFMRCEEDFGIEIPDEDAEQCQTVGLLTGYIQRKFGVEPTQPPQGPWEKPV